MRASFRRYPDKLSPKIMRRSFGFEILLDGFQRLPLLALFRYVYASMQNAYNAYQSAEFDAEFHRNIAEILRSSHQGSRT